MSAYIKQLNAAMAIATLARREGKERAGVQAARDRLTPLEDRVARLLVSIPLDVQHEGLSLPALKAALRGRWRGSCHPGDLGPRYASSGLSGVGSGVARGAFERCGIPSADRPPLDGVRRLPICRNRNNGRREAGLRFRASSDGSQIKNCCLDPK
jgi:hypothetical protein